MKLFKNITLFLLLGILFTNCTVLKKRYSHGYTVNWNKSNKTETAFTEGTLEFDKKIEPNKIQLGNSIIDSLPNESTLVVIEPVISIEQSVKKDIPSLKIEKKAGFYNQVKKTYFNTSEETLHIIPESILAFGLSLSALILITLYFITFTPLLLLIGGTSLVIGFIMAVIANKIRSKNPEKYNKLSKHFIIFSSILYFLTLLGLIITTIIALFLLYAIGSLLAVIGLLFLIIVLLALILITSTSFNAFKKSFKTNTKEKPSNPFLK